MVWESEKKVWTPLKSVDTGYFFTTFFLIDGEYFNPQNALHVVFARLHDSFDHHCELQSSINCLCDRKLSLENSLETLETVELVYCLCFKLIVNYDYRCKYS